MEQSIYFILARGLFFSLICGHFITNISLELIRLKWAPYKDEYHNIGIPAEVIGLIERLFFTILVASNVNGTAIAMIAWITLKITPKLHYFKGPKGESISHEKLMAIFATFLAGMISMLCATIGGLMILEFRF